MELEQSQGVKQRAAAARARNILNCQANQEDRERKKEANQQRSIRRRKKKTYEQAERRRGEKWIEASSRNQNETAEEAERRREEGKIRASLRRQTETIDETERRKELARIRMSLKRQNETVEEAERRREVARIRASLKRLNETIEERERRREVARIQTSLQRQNETNEEVERRNEKSRRRLSWRRHNETNEEGERRREQVRRRLALKRQNETHEETERRREEARIRISLMRQNREDSSEKIKTSVMKTRKESVAGAPHVKMFCVTKPGEKAIKPSAELISKVLNEIPEKSSSERVFVKITYSQNKKNQSSSGSVKKYSRVKANNVENVDVALPDDNVASHASVLGNIDPISGTFVSDDGNVDMQKSCEVASLLPNHSLVQDSGGGLRIVSDTPNVSLKPLFIGNNNVKESNQKGTVIKLKQSSFAAPTVSLNGKQSKVFLLQVNSKTPLELVNANQQVLGDSEKSCMQTTSPKQQSIVNVMKIDNILSNACSNNSEQAAGHSGQSVNFSTAGENLLVTSSILRGRHNYCLPITDNSSHVDSTQDSISVNETPRPVLEPEIILKVYENDVWDVQRLKSILKPMPSDLKTSTRKKSCQKSKKVTKCLKKRPKNKVIFLKANNSRICNKRLHVANSTEPDDEIEIVDVVCESEIYSVNGEDKNSESSPFDSISHKLGNEDADSMMETADSFLFEGYDYEQPKSSADDANVINDVQQKNATICEFTEDSDSITIMSDEVIDTADESANRTDLGMGDDIDALKAILKNRQEDLIKLREECSVFAKS